MCWPQLANGSSTIVMDAISTKVIDMINMQMNNTQYF